MYWGSAPHRNVCLEQREVSMPIYEYRCKKCGEVFDELVPNVDAEIPPCPKCEAVGAEKLMSLIGGVHAGSARASCPSGPTCSTAAQGGCRSCPMTGM